MEKYIVWHKDGIRACDKVGGFFESYKSYSEDNYTKHPMKAKHYTSLVNALKHRVGLEKKSYDFAIETDKKIKKQFHRLKKFKVILDEKENPNDYKEFKIFTNDKNEEITIIYKLIIDDNEKDFQLINARVDVHDYIKKIMKDKEDKDIKLHNFTFENTNQDMIVDNPDDDFWN